MIICSKIGCINYLSLPLSKSLNFQRIAIIGTVGLCGGNHLMLNPCLLVSAVCLSENCFVCGKTQFGRILVRAASIITGVRGESWKG